MPGVRAVVTGRVQGVGFRAYVAASASMDGVRGEVWNRRDGSVELIAWHDEPESLERFQDSLARGPGHADNVSAQPSEDAQGCAGFRVVVRG